MPDATASGPNASERLLAVHRFVGLVFCLLISWSIWTGILAFYADFIRPWMMPEVARAAVLSAGGAPPEASRTYDHVAVRHEVGSHWTMMAPNDLRPFFIFSGRIIAKDEPTAGNTPLSNLMVHPDTGLMAPWNGSLADGLFRRIHTDLLLPKPWGRLLMGIAGVLIVMLTLGGLFIHGKMIRDAWAWRRRSPVLNLSDGHKRFGFWLTPYLLLLGLTGAVLGMKVASVPIGAILWSGGDARVAAALVRESGETARGNAPPVARDAVSAGIDRCVRSFLDRFPDTRLGRLRRDEGILMVEGIPFGRLSWAGEGAGALRSDCALATGEIVAVHDAREDGGPGVVESALRPIHYGRFGGLGTGLIYCVLALLCLWNIDTGMRLLWLRDGTGAAAPAMGRVPWSFRIYAANNTLYVCLPLLLLLDNLLAGTTHWGLLAALTGGVVALHCMPFADDARNRLVGALTPVIALTYAALPLARQLMLPDGPWWECPPIPVIDLTLAAFGAWLLWRSRGQRAGVTSMALLQRLRGGRSSRMGATTWTSPPRPERPGRATKVQDRR
ncbi:PepSY domain-containing protein [Azospirillum sp. RWY-5-1]|uniref:PepSY domain-containing protein n=1 Tax=Azospirillum oleiclasticum TaxID=2735135 RepID=A0ABX2TIE8_9PROT|nr:PepSY-associated TM helix domain-containing protein [Azospirillum oleiclasticum]NYZ15087.1 PepSY domain-containing protein [Azospirillum oleiclasticum]NYZ22849.1 PepSY domain-containing protein [Azospirillum oleiclasticum]